MPSQPAPVPPAAPLPVAVPAVMPAAVLFALLASGAVPAAQGPAAEAAGLGSVDRALDPPAPVDLGTRREPFLDRHLVESLVGAELVLGRPHDEGPVLRFDQPWEGPFSGYSTLILDERDPLAPRYLLYYRGLPVAGRDGSAAETTCLAISEDGREFRRPELELFPLDGAPVNNVVLAGVAPVTHNFSPFLDPRPDVPADERFKGLGGTGASGLRAFGSPDGVRWSPLADGAVFTQGVFDSQNVSFWSEHEQRYVCYFRTWTAPVAMTFGDAPLEHLYTNQTHPYFRAPHVYVGIAARFLPGRQVLSDAEAAARGVDPRYYRDCSDAVLLTSRGGSAYDRTFLEGFVRPGLGPENWVSRSNYPALGIVPTGPGEMSFYVNRNYAQPTAALHRYSLRLDGLASVRAPRAGGELRTVPLRFAGERLTLNVATSAAGSVAVEVQDERGEALPGFALEDCVPVIGNELAREVRWRGGPDLGTHAGRAVRLRIRLVDADLYSLRFLGPEPIEHAENSPRRP